MTTIRQFAAITTLLALAVLLGALTWSVITITHAVQALPARLDAAVEREAMRIRADALGAIQNAQAGILAEVAELRRGGTSALAGVLDKADAQLTAANASLANVAAIRDDLKPTLEASAALTVDVQASLDALYPDIAAITGNVAVTTRSTGEVIGAAERVAPVVAQDVQQGVHDAAAAVANVKEMTKPSKWYVKAARFVLRLFI
jgi:hypothetical protein